MVPLEFEVTERTQKSAALIAWNSGSFGGVKKTGSFGVVETIFADLAYLWAVTKSRK